MTKELRRAVMCGTDYDKKVWELSYFWTINDGGRSLSKRPRQKNDCTVRALAIARGLSYDDAYDILKNAGRSCSRGFHFPDWMASQVWGRKISFPAVKGQRRMNPAAFVVAFPNGRYICQVAKHIFAVVDGVVHDIFENAPDRCIYSIYWLATVKALMRSPPCPSQ